jgi:hypothetical protein
MKVSTKNRRIKSPENVPLNYYLSDVLFLREKCPVRSILRGRGYEGAKECMMGRGGNKRPRRRLSMKKPATKIS